MDGLARLGQVFSAIVMIALYVESWFWAVGNLKYYKAVWKRVLAKTFIGLHILAILAWFAWSWIYLF